jgi:hypothetical protein
MRRLDFISKIKKDYLAHFPFEWKYGKEEKGNVYTTLPNLVTNHFSLIYPRIVGTKLIKKYFCRNKRHCKIMLTIIQWSVYLPTTYSCKYERKNKRKNSQTTSRPEWNGKVFFVSKFFTSRYFRIRSWWDDCVKSVLPQEKFLAQNFLFLCLLFKLILNCLLNVFRYDPSDSHMEKVLQEISFRNGF